MAEEFEWIGDVRGRGVLFWIELVTDRRRKTPADDELRRITSYALEKGLVYQARGARGLANVIRLVPPMTTTGAEVDRAMSIFHYAFRHVLGTQPLGQFPVALHPPGRDAATAAGTQAFDATAQFRHLGIGPGGLQRALDGP